MRFTIDIEPTNRCNAKCHFCPRDQTPHQGLMQPVVFERSLARAVEFRDWATPLGREVVVSLCGLGEPLLNRHLPDYIAQVRGEGFHCSTSTNGALLDQRRSEAILEAGVQQVMINVGEEGDDYESVYQLPFEKTRENVVRFAEMASDDVEVYIVLVDHRRDADHIRHMKEFWRAQGIDRFWRYDIMNRGGALFVDHMAFETFGELEQARTTLADVGANAVCGAPFGFMFVGYDGVYYLCCSDWKKEVPLGTVFDASLLDVVEPKLVHAATRAPICETCNLDPVNRLTEELRAAADGHVRDDDVAGLVERLRQDGETVTEVVDALRALPQFPQSGSSRTDGRRSIPVTVV